MKKLLCALLCISILTICFSPAVIASSETDGTPYDDSRFFETGDYSIHYRVKEASSAKGYILYIHGFAMSGACFDELSDIMCENGYTCVLADLPGYGYSTRETADTQALPREQIMYELTQSIYAGKWIIAGHSMGGYVALSMLASYPQAVETLLLYGTSGNDGLPQGTEKMLSNELIIKAVGSIMEVFAKCKLLVNILFAANVGDNGYARSYDIEKVAAPLRIDGTGAGAMYAMLRVTPTDYEAVRNFGSPLLFINGSKDSVISRADRDKLESYLPEGSQSYIIENGYHLFIQNKAEEVAALTLDFLAD